MRAGLRPTALEPAPTMAAIAAGKLEGRGEVWVGRFEDWTPSRQFPLLAAFNAWHWIEPGQGVELAAKVVRPGGSLALVWTEVVAWGSPSFARRLAEMSGGPWATGSGGHIEDCLRPMREDDRFSSFEVRRHRFERTLDGATFVAVTQTYGGNPDPEGLAAIQRAVDDEAGGTVTKVEEAVLYLARRRD